MLWRTPGLYSILKLSWNAPKRRFQSFGMLTFNVSVHQHLYIHCKFRDAKQYTKHHKKKTVSNVRNGKKTKDVTGCKVLSHPTTKQIQSFLRTLCHSTWRSARSSPARSLGRFKRVVLLQLEIGAKKHEVLWHIYIECLTLRHWRTY